MQDCLVDICLCCTSCVECNEAVEEDHQKAGSNNKSREDATTSRHLPQTYKMYDESIQHHQHTRKIPIQTTMPTSRTIVISDAFEDQVLSKQKTSRRYNDKKPPYSKHK